MIKPRLNWILAVFAMGFVTVTPPAFADSLDDAVRKISSAMAGIKAVQYKTTFTTHTKIEDFEMHSTGTTLSEYKRNTGSGYLLRNEVVTKSTRKIQGKVETNESSTLMLFDGKDYYTLTDNGSQKTAMKMPYDHAATPNPYDGQPLFAFYRRISILTLLPDESVDGKRCYGIESVPKAEDGGPVSGGTRTRMYYDKKTGIVLKSVSYDGTGNEILTSVTTEIKIDPRISDDRFVFKAPPGVQVIEVNAAQAQTETQAKAPTGQPKAKAVAEQKTPEKKTTEKKTKPAQKKTADKPEKKEKKKGLGGLLKKLKIP